MIQNGLAQQRLEKGQLRSKAQRVHALDLFFLKLDALKGLFKLLGRGCSLRCTVEFSVET